MEDQVFNLVDLARKADVSLRQVRYLVSLKLVPPPKGGRKDAYYTQEHLDAILRVKSFEEQGVRLQAIPLLIDAMPTTLTPVPGVKIVIQSKRIPRDFDREAFMKAFNTHLAPMLKEQDDDTSLNA